MNEASSTTVSRTVIDPELGEQLSALMDGELDAERSRFLLRRIAADPALGEVWERWQSASCGLRGTRQRRVDAGFAGRVRAALDSDQAAAAAPAAGRVGVAARWVAGAAVAASVALVALLAVEPAADPTPPSLQLAAPVAEAPLPSSVAPSPLRESDLRPRLFAPADVVSVQQRGPVAQPLHGADPRVQPYLLLHEQHLREAGIGAFMPYVEAARGDAPTADGGRAR